ncbi:cadherin-like domain-containing protein [Crenothrix polyspora]|uniref:N,N-dimethylformamidase beta subunit-like C-terminal domain-containing protein n=1 Tax=Crenothrix polyspora TaxID=360316 RepID=A0A1R4HEK0_9GAMM|nr:cadherin-like domain-containing protein [Crenothrix polyspora]SJM94461.1 exported hypothetical protein [Crenothrix polyspora]
MSIHRTFFAKKYTYLIIPSALALCTTAQMANAAVRNAIVLENLKRGTNAWQHVDQSKLIGSKRPNAGPTIASAMPNVSAETATCTTRSPAFPWGGDDCISGYTSTPSVNKGGSIDFKVSVNPAQNFTINFYRLGWYGGNGGTSVTSTAALPATTQQPCVMEYKTGLAECNWSNSYTLNVPSTWTTGVYLAQLTSATGWKSEILFVVKDDSRPADFLYEVPVLTYLAYNNYPDGTGKSLYDSNSAGNAKAVKVSLDSPQDHQFGTWLGSDWTEIHLVAWLEKMGYNINYTTDLDVHTAAANLKAYKGVIIGGHSEYWTKAMYDNTEQARDAGVNLAFFGANAAHWQVRMENSSSGIPNRVLTCYKDENGSSNDPVKDATQTKKWRDLGRAEQTLIGVQHDIDGWNLGLSNQHALKLQETNHWAYNGSGLSDGNLIPYLVGYEIDNFNPSYPKPPLLTPTSQTFIAESPYYNHSNALYKSQASLYQAPSGAWVFGSGTMSWSWALAKQASDSYVFQNTAIQKVTQNILDAFKSKPTSSNRSPVAINDSANVNQDATVSISVLNNDSDPDGNSLTISAVGVAAHGVVANNGTSITYTPTASYYGNDSFNYTVSDGFNGTATANVAVSVNRVNRAPIANKDSAVVNQNATVSILVLNNDSDPDGNSLKISALSTAAHGAVSHNGRVITYKPVANYKGNDSFTYTISDGFNGTATASVDVTVKPITYANRRPIAIRDSAKVISLRTNKVVSISPLNNDSDPDGNTLTLLGFTKPKRGTLTQNGNVLTFTATSSGQDSFNYTISDGLGGTATAPVYITIGK